MSNGVAVERERYEETLRRNRVWLRRFLEAEQRVEDHLHLLVAARLRVLLHNGSDGPALLDYAQRMGRTDELTIWGPYGAEESGRVCPLRRVRWSRNEQWSDQLNPVRYQIEDYLEQPVGWWRISGGRGEIRLDLYTPLDLINWAANSEAVHHLPASSEPVQRLAGVRRFVVHPPPNVGPEEAEVRGDEYVAEDLFSLGEWTVSAIDHLLGEPEAAGE